MLIRVSYTRSETIPQPAGAAGFDENVNRTTRDLQFVDWGEFLVAWRKDNIEIYRDHVSYLTFCVPPLCPAVSAAAAT